MNIVRQDDVVTVYMLQRCEGEYAKKLYQALVDTELKTISNVIFDFNDTLFIDSSSVGMLVTIDKNLKAQDTCMTIRNLKKDIADLFSDTGLNLLFNIETEEGITEASVNLFETGVDIKLDVQTEVRDDVCIFHMSGVMNHPVGSRFFKQQFLLAIAEHKKILLDFEELTFFDSLSVSVVLSMHKLLKETGGSLRFCNTNYIVQDLFTTLNINQIIPIYETIESALADWE
jgi:anti-anti-sigma factor